MFLPVPLRRAEPAVPPRSSDWPADVVYLASVIFTPQQASLTCRGTLVVVTVTRISQCPCPPHESTITLNGAR